MVINVDESNYTIEMTYIEGKKLKDHINNPALTEQELKILVIQMGKLVSKVHEAGVIHGDLTTSNMIVQ